MNIMSCPVMHSIVADIFFFDPFSYRPSSKKEEIKEFYRKCDQISIIKSNLTIELINYLHA